MPPYRAEYILTALALPLMLVVGLTTPFAKLSDLAITAAVVATWLVLTMRLRYPVPVLVIVVIIDSVGIGLVDHHGQSVATVPLATMLALYTVASRSPVRVAWIWAAAVAATQFAVSVIDYPTSADWLYLNWAVVAAVVGRLTKERRDRMAAAELRADTAERTKQVEAERQVAAERMRIAHDLHDVLAHHIAVINAQAGVAEYLLTRDPATAAQALGGITANSKAALEELRATLGFLRADGDPDPTELRTPAPTVEQLDRLLDGFTTAGMQLRASSSGERAPMSSAAELAYYRIVQEALTNATKHAPGTNVSLKIEWAATHVTLTITNSRVAQPHGAGGGTGHGLIGMRERASAAGGTVVAGPTADGGYQVTATLPLLPAPFAAKASELLDQRATNP
jgi:signal transduction histidine kinase